MMDRAASSASRDIDRVVSNLGDKVPGLAVVAVSPEKVAFSSAWGLADIDSGAVMKPKTVCNWFSMTKPVTATAVMQLAEKGLLELERPVCDYYPQFSGMRPIDRSRAVTIGHLLSHSSGLTNPLPLRWIHPATEPGPDPADLVSSLLAKHDRLRFEPGTDAKYSNLGYLVLGQVIAMASGQPYEAYVKQHVLEPLGMSQTGFVADSTATWATPYQRRRTPINVALRLLLPNKIIGPNHGRFRSLTHFYLDGASYGGLVGPASDAARFVRAQLADGHLDGVRILAPESSRAMRTIRARGKGISVGLGWYRRGSERTLEFVEHLGGGAGFWNCMRLYPDQEIGLVMMGNATKYDHNVIADAVVDFLTSGGADNP